MQFILYIVVLHKVSLVDLAEKSMNAN